MALHKKFKKHGAINSTADILTNFTSPTFNAANQKLLVEK